MNKPSKIKYIASCITIAISMQVFANGVYFISGADFRRPMLKYVIQTTEPNEEVEVTPYALKSFSTISGVQNTKPYTDEGWSVKYDGVNHDIAKTNAIRQTIKYTGLTSWGSVQALAPEAVLMDPVMHTFANPGNHIVSIYSPSWNVFSVLISNPAVTKVSIDLEALPYSTTTYPRCGVSVASSPNVTKIIYNNPTRGLTVMKDIYKLDRLSQVVVKHPDLIGEFDNYAFAYCPELVFDFGLFTNLTSVGYMCFRDCVKIQHALLPKVQKIGGYIFSLGAIPGDGEGLLTLRLGDAISTVGKETFGRQSKLDTIEFVTDNPNWMDAWNNHAILPNWFGQASNQEGNKATLTPTDDTTATTYYDTLLSSRPKPTRLVYVGGYDAN